MKKSKDKPSSTHWLKGKYAVEVMAYVDGVISGRIPANRDRVLGAERFKRMVTEGKYDIRPHDADYVISIIHRSIRHRQGQNLAGEPMRGQPYILEPWQMFCVYGMLCFYKKGTDERLVKEVLIFIPRKNSKTLFAASLAWGLAWLERKSGSKVYVIGAALKQALESFDSWMYCVERSLYNSKKEAVRDGWKLYDSSMGHVVEYACKDGGSIRLEALAYNPDAQDSLNANVCIADEIHAYKEAKPYELLRDAGKAYTNRLMIGITTAGDNGTGFCAQRVQYCRKVLNGTVEDEQYFIFISCADPKEDGTYDYTNPLVHQQANPNYGITIRPQDMLNAAIQAQNDPQSRNEFYNKSLNVFTSSMRAYFDVEQFRASNREAEKLLGIRPEWTLERKIMAILSHRPQWYGGTDLSKLHDLTAAALYCTVGDVDVILPHCWFPVVAAAQKAREDNIPLFGWQDDGWLDMVNKPTNDADTVVAWYLARKKQGFRIAEVGHDRKFCREYFVAMKKAKFKIVDQPQYFYKKSEGFRHIEARALNRRLYYFGSDAFEYCVQNIRAIEKTDDMVEFEKIQPEHRIDIFDASVFACVRMLETMGKLTAKEWNAHEKA